MHSHFSARFTCWISHCSEHKLNSLTVTKNLDHKSNKSRCLFIDMFMHSQDTVDYCKETSLPYEKKKDAKSYIFRIWISFPWCAPANSDCKGVLFQHQCSRPPCILKDVNGKEHPDLGKSARAQIPSQIHFWPSEEVLFLVIL